MREIVGGVKEMDPSEMDSPVFVSLIVAFPLVRIHLVLPLFPPRVLPGDELCWGRAAIAVACTDLLFLLVNVEGRSAENNIICCKKNPAQSGAVLPGAAMSLSPTQSLAVVIT